MKEKKLIKVLFIILIGCFIPMFAQLKPVADKDFPKEVKQMDFWIGDWEFNAEFHTEKKIYKSKGKDQCIKVANRIVESHLKGKSGNSVFFQNSYMLYDITNKKWRMTVLDPNWGQYNLTGKKIGKTITLTSLKRDGDLSFYRIAIFNIKKESFNIIWAISQDQKKTWKNMWFVNYKRKK